MVKRKAVRLLGLVLVLLTIFSLAFHTSSSEWNQDLGRHIGLGRIILANKSVPRTNLFSYVEEDFSFQNHHWLSEVFLALTYQFFGNSGLIWLKVIIVLLAWGVLFWLISENLPVSWTMLLSILPILVFKGRTDIRPEIFGLFLFSFFLVIFTRAKKGKLSLLWWLPVGQLFWVNLHISFVFGQFLVGLFLLSFLSNGKRRFLKKILPPLVLAIVINLANPGFLKGALAPFLIWQNYNYQVVENQSIFFLTNLGYYFNTVVFFKLGLVLGLIVFFLRRGEKLAFFGWLVLSVVAAWQIRHFPFWALYSFWFWGISLGSSKRKLTNKVTLALGRLAGGASLLGFLIIILSGITNFSFRLSDSGRSFGLGGDQPCRQAALFLLTNFPEKKIFNNFDIGSYLDYYYPDIRVFADSRPEAFSGNFWQKYRDAQLDWQEWQQIVLDYQIGAVFISHTDQTYWTKQFLSNLYQSASWRLVYLDDNVVIFVPKEEERPEVALDGSFLNTFTESYSLIKLANFFSLIGRDDLVRLSLEKALAVNPWSYRANVGLVSYYLQSGNPALQFKAQALAEKANSWWYKIW